jgi:2-methylisocitrate lyase-like PEP mutase family enzyme
MMPTVAEKRARFAELHQGPGCFVMPNPWDVGSTVYLGSLGFKALATTSAGMAFAAGQPDNGVTLSYTLRHIAELVAATPLPVNADFEAGFAATPGDLHENVRLCIGMGVAGFSIEDYTGDAKAPFFGFAESVDRIRAARAAIDASGERVMLTARSETIWAGHPDGLKEALRRLAAFAEAGADVLFAPGLKTPESVAEVVRVAGALPVNVVVGAPGFTHRQLEDLGVRRISTGAGLARAAWGALMRAAEQIAGEGRFDAFAEGAPAARLNELFRSRASQDEAPAEMSR